MSIKPEKRDLVDLAIKLEEYKLNGERLTLFLGARTGGLFRSENFKEDMSFSSVRVLATMLQHEYFSECWNILQREKESSNPSDMAALLDRALQDLNFSAADTFLAGLIREEIFNIIFSTGVGNLLEKALDAQDFIDEGKFSYIMFTPEKYSDNIYDIVHEKLGVCKLFKIHEDVQTYAYDFFMEDSDIKKGRFVKDLLKKMRIKHLLMVGIDPLWDRLLLSSLPSNIETVWFVNEEEHVMKSFFDGCNHIESLYYIVGKNGSYDIFFRTLYLHMGSESPVYHEIIHDIKHQLLSMQSELQQIKKILIPLKSIEKDLREIHRQTEYLSKRLEHLDRPK